MNTSQLTSGMIETRVLNSHFIARLYTSNDLITYHNFTMTRLSSHHLVDALTCSISQTNNVASHSEMQCITTIIIFCDTLCREACIRSRIGTNRRTSQSHRNNSIWSKCVIKNILGIKIVEHIELSINILHSHLRINAIYHSQIVLVDDDVGCDIISLFTYSNYKDTSILRPDSPPISTTHKVLFGSTTIFIDMYSIICNEYDGSTHTYSCQQLVFNFYHRVVSLSIEIQYSKVIIWLNKIVGCDRVGKFPVTHRQDIIGVANFC